MRLTFPSAFRLLAIYTSAIKARKITNPKFLNTRPEPEMGRLPDFCFFVSTTAIAISFPQPSYGRFSLCYFLQSLFCRAQWVFSPKASRVSAALRTHLFPALPEDYLFA